MHVDPVAYSTLYTLQYMPAGERSVSRIYRGEGSTHSNVPELYSKCGRCSPGLYNAKLPTTTSRCPTYLGMYIVGRSPVEQNYYLLSSIPDGEMGAQSMQVGSPETSTSTMLVRYLIITMSNGSAVFPYIFI